MPAKSKKPKPSDDQKEVEPTRPSFKVEEKVETPAAEPTKESSADVIDLTKPPQEESKDDAPKEDAGKTPDVPKVSSFSMLDASKKPDADSPEKPKEESEELTVSGAPKEHPMQEPPTDQDAGDTSEKDEEESKSEDVKEWLKDIRPDTTKEVEKKSRLSLRPILLILMVLALLAVLAGGFFYYREGVEKALPIGSKSEESTEPQATATLTPTPEKLDFTTYKVSVLNGTGVAGAAGELSDLLTDLGFDNIEAGNADNYDYESTTVSMKESVPEAVYAQLENKLSENYTVVRSDDKLEDTSSYDIIIITGVTKEE